jgi:hypothetical protein
MSRPDLRHTLSLLVVTSGALLAFALAWFAVALHQGELPAFHAEVQLQPGARLLIRNKRPCLLSEPSMLCYYRSFSPQTFSIVYSAPGVRRALLSFELPRRPERRPALLAASW